MGCNTVAQDPGPHIPIEVFENVIDSLYSTPLDDQLQSSNALRSCALVCRAWRVRAQMMLFHSVVLSDSATLYRFSTALDLGRHLSGYVRELILTGRSLHTTTSVFALFPSVLRGKVPNLKDLHVIHIPEDADWYPDSPVERRQRKLQCVPLHSRFPLLLSTGFLAIKHLHLEDVTFRYFSDFVRTINSLRNLQSLVCYNVRWITLGAFPACMARHDERAAPQSPFAPNLEELLIKSPGIYGAERDLTNDAQAFTRHAYLDVLRALGRITEDWFRDVSEEEDVPDLRQSIKVRVYDWEKRREWWWGRVQASFPTWVRLRRLDMEYLMPRNEDDIWKGDAVPSSCRSPSPNLGG